MKTNGGRKSRSLDVRPMIARDESPFLPIMDAVGALQSGESLQLITPFLPSPLIERLHAEGFSARPERRGDGSWCTMITRL